VMASGAVTRLHADQVPCQGRRTQGRPLVRPAKGDSVVEVTRAYSETVGRRSEAEVAAAAEESEESEGGQNPEAGDAVSVSQLDLLG